MAPEEAQEWAVETKKELVQSSEVHLSDLRNKIDELENQAAKKGGQAQQKWKNELRPELERKLAQAEKKLAELKDSSEGAWKDLKAAIQESVSDVADSYEAAEKELQEN